MRCYQRRFRISWQLLSASSRVRERALAAATSRHGLCDVPVSLARRKASSCRFGVLWTSHGTALYKHTQILAATITSGFIYASTSLTKQYCCSFLAYKLGMPQRQNIYDSACTVKMPAAIYSQFIDKYASYNVSCKKIND